MKVFYSTIFFLLPICLLTQPNFDFNEIATGFTRPVDIANAGDGTNRLFIVEKAGIIKIIELDNGNNILSDPFLDIRSLVDDNGNEQGLLGLVFHPEYPDSGYFYVNYTRDPGAGLDRTVVARYEVSSTNPDSADENSELKIIEIEQDNSNHNGGDLNFGTDGYLYIGMGDGGGSGDPNCRSQDTSYLLGKMLRIDVDTIDANPPDDLCGLVNNYLVPPDNPYLGGSNTCDEIWAMGLRNPWRFSFDSDNGDLYIADVGQNSKDEINMIKGTSPAINYGWSVMEGNDCFDPDPLNVNCPSSTASCYDGSYTAPIFEYELGDECAVTGGYVYRGSSYPNMIGYYMFIDYCTSKIWSLISDGNGGWIDNSQILAGYGNITTFGESESKEIYAAEDSGGASVYQLIDNSIVPIEFIDFTAKKVDSGLSLHWVVGYSLNFSHFEVEKRMELSFFKTIGSIHPGPEELDGGEFSYLDENVVPGTNYYRIKMIDLNGNFKYSKIIEFEKTGQIFEVYPNPATDKIHFKFNKEFHKAGFLSLYNYLGKSVYRIRFGGGESTIDISSASLKEGLYLFCYENGSYRACRKIIVGY